MAYFEIMEGEREEIKVLKEAANALKKENTDLKQTLNKLKSYVHPRFHYLYFKETKETK
jgi:hypothetical protein